MMCSKHFVSVLCRHRQFCPSTPTRQSQFITEVLFAHLLSQKSTSTLNEKVEEYENFKPFCKRVVIYHNFQRLRLSPASNLSSLAFYKRIFRLQTSPKTLRISPYRLREILLPARYISPFSKCGAISKDPISIYFWSFTH